MRLSTLGARSDGGGGNGIDGVGTRDIRRALGEPSFSRGQAVFRLGAVRTVAVEPPGRVRARVKGTRPQPYSVSAELVFGPGGTLRSVVGECSCPVGFNCKHVAAALLAAADSPGPRSEAPDVSDTAPGRGDIRRWLGRRPEGGGKPAEDRLCGPAEPGKVHLFYVVHRNEFSGMHITPYRAYLKKDGTIGTDYQAFTDSRSAWARANLTRHDAALLGELEFLGAGRYGAGVKWPEGRDLVDLIRAVVQTGRALEGSIHGPSLSWGAPRPCELRWEVGEAGVQRAVARDPDGSALRLLGFSTPLYVDPETGETGVADTGLEPRTAAWLAQAPAVPPGEVESVASALSGIAGPGPVPRPQRLRERAGVQPEAVLTLYGCEQAPVRYGHEPFAGHFGPPGARVYPCARLEIAYGGAAQRVRPGKGPEWLAAGGDPPAVIARNRAGERALRHRLVRAGERHGGREPYGLGFAASPPEGLFEADMVLPVFEKGDEAASGSGVGFVSRAVPELQEAGWRVRIEDTWPFRVFDGPVSYSTSVEPSGTDWFSLCLRLEAGGAEFDIAPLVIQLVESLPVDGRGRLERGFDIGRHLAGRQFHAELEDGTYLAIDASRFARFAEEFLEAQGLAGFHRAEAGRLFELAEALEGCGAPWSGGRELLELGARLAALARTPDVAPPPALLGELRPYQRAGYGWLKVLSECGFGGVLADDMGLGKTVQTLALLAYRHLDLGVRRPSLLVVPTSLVGNWRREAGRFVPELKLLVLHGPGRRRRFGDIPGHHLVVTTYPLVYRDHDALFCHEYDTAVLDEAQAVKNPAAGVSKRIRDIRARQRLALTGTPLENNLQELWSLYDWLIPGLLGARKAFAKHYRTPIEKRGDAARQRLLSTRIKPFLMRRTKEEVAEDLPDKTVIDERVPLEGS